MKKRKDEFSNSNTRHSINYSKDNNLKEKKSRFEFLYENSSIHDKKLDLIRAKNYFNQQERMTPVISQKSKNLKRPKELFYKRLYKSDNETSIDFNKIKNNNKEKNKLKSEKEKEKQSTKEEKENEKNNSISDNSEESKENDKKISDEENLYIMDNKKKNEQYKKYYKNLNIKSRNSSFLFKPKINNKSKLIASKLKTNSSERLFSLSLKQKENLKTIFQKKRIEKEMKLKRNEEKKMLKMKNYTYKPNVKNNKRKWVDKLYEKGINSIKKKEEEIKNEQLLNEKEYLQYSFSPMINRNYSYSYLNRSNNISINSINTKINPKMEYRNNRSYIKNSKLNKSGFYERSINWKKLIEKKKEELRKRINKDNNSLTIEENNLNPQTNNEVLETDVSFIRKNFIEYQTFLDRYNYNIIKRNLDKINYRKINIPPKKVYAKKLVVEFVNECDSNCPTNAGTIKYYCDKRPINEINKNRDELKISDFFQNDVKLETKNFINYEQEYIKNSTKIPSNKKSKTVPKQHKNYVNNLSFFNAVNSLINKIE